jgi:hypothetical protein
MEKKKRTSKGLQSSRSAMVCREVERVQQFSRPDGKGFYLSPIQTGNRGIGKGKSEVTDTHTYEATNRNHY